MRCGKRQWPCLVRRHGVTYPPWTQTPTALSSKQAWTQSCSMRCILKAFWTERNTQSRGKRTRSRRPIWRAGREPFIHVWPGQYSTCAYTSRLVHSAREAGRLISMISRLRGYICTRRRSSQMHGRPTRQIAMLREETTVLNCH